MLETILMVMLVLFCYAVLVEPRWYRIKRIQVRSKKKIPRAIKILHLSDTHFSQKGRHREKFLERLVVLEPDFLFITGDIIDHNDGIEMAAAVLGSLRARLGKFAVFGNHDYYDYRTQDILNYHLRGIKTATQAGNTGELARQLELRGIRVLKNSNATVAVDGMTFVIAGTDDPVTQTVDFAKTCRGIGNESFNILLTHVLDSIVGLPEVDFDLVFSGHTHGGQIRFPRIGGMMRGFGLPRRYLEGIHHFRQMITCVSRGVSASRTLSLRFCCRPEAILLDVIPPS